MDSALMTILPLKLARWPDCIGTCICNCICICTSTVSADDEARISILSLVICVRVLNGSGESPHHACFFFLTCTWTCTCSIICAKAIIFTTANLFTDSVIHGCRISIDCTVTYRQGNFSCWRIRCYHPPQWILFVSNIWVLGWRQFLLCHLLL